MSRTHVLLPLTLVLAAPPFRAGAQARTVVPVAAPKSAAAASSLGYEVEVHRSSKAEGSTSIEVGDRTWSAQGYDLRGLIAQIYGMDERRVELAGHAMDGQRFDMSVSLPAGLSDGAIQRLLEDAVARRFGVQIVLESRAMPVYVLTAPNGAGSALHRRTVSARAEDGGSITISGQNCTNGNSSTGIDVTAGTLADFGRTVEPDLDRPLVDETHLAGSFDFRVDSYANQQELFRRLHDQLGLVVTPGQRSVPVLTVKPASGGANLQARL